jgi:hypothetical protein
MQGRVSQALQELRRQRKLCVDGSNEAVRLDELIRLAGGSGEPIEDQVKKELLADRQPKEKRPQLF